MMKRLPPLLRSRLAFTLLIPILALSGTGVFCEGSSELNMDMLRQADPDFSPQWSSDASFILFTEGSLWDGTVYTVQSDGTQLKRLSAGGNRNLDVGYSPDLSPDDSYVVYATTRYRPDEQLEYRSLDLELVSSDGSGRRRLTNTQFWDVSPTWSPDGSRIAFMRTRESGPCTAETGLFLIHPDTGEEERIVPASEASGLCRGWVVGPEWSPTGTELLYVGSSSAYATEPQQRHALGRRYLYSVDVEGKNLKQLFATDYWIIQQIPGTPAWSPDGQWIVFATYVEPGYKERLIARRQRSELFSTYWNENEEERTYTPGLLEIHVIDRYGSNMRTLLSLPDYYWSVFSRVGAPRFDWSPDGKTILMSDGQTVLLLDADEGGITGEIDGAYGAWSEDGQRIAVSNMTRVGQESGPMIFNMNAKGFNKRTLVEIEYTATTEGLIVEVYFANERFERLNRQ